MDNVIEKVGELSQWMTGRIEGLWSSFSAPEPPSATLPVAGDVRREVVREVSVPSQSIPVGGLTAASFQALPTFPTADVEHPDLPTFPRGVASFPEAGDLRVPVAEFPDLADHRPAEAPAPIQAPGASRPVNGPTGDPRAPLPEFEFTLPTYKLPEARESDPVSYSRPGTTSRSEFSYGPGPASMLSSPASFGALPERPRQSPMGELLSAIKDLSAGLRNVGPAARPYPAATDSGTWSASFTSKDIELALPAAPSMETMQRAIRNHFGTK